MITVILILMLIPTLLRVVEALKREKAYQFIVDGEEWFIISDQDALERILQEYQDGYLDNIDENAQVKKIAFSQEIEIIEVEVRPEEIDPLETAVEQINAIEEEAAEIVIKSGDNFWNLSKTHNITVSELEILNPDVDPDRIFPGDKLVIRPLNPVLDVIIELENTVIEPIPFRVEQKKDNTLLKTQKRIIREGVEGEKEVLYQITLLNGYQSSLEIKEEKNLKEPVNALVQIGTKTTVARGVNANYGVVNGKRISSYYGYRIHPITGRRRFHEGIDIAANHGNNVYAYTDGRVVEAGWNGGYGYCILLDHGNGLKTRYAHLSKIYARIGQRIQTGARIGAIGSTGNSTGPHLHFEVIKNGQTKNPLNYI